MLIESLKQFKTDYAGLLFDCYLSIDKGELSCSDISMCLSYTLRPYIMYSLILKAYLLFSLDTLNRFSFVLISAISMVEDAC